ncbi:hypothetical protein Cfor_06087 [Coptotermes formosanus]|uniref:Uncharacterized protein n=1 Tax=Coptotermes formosanus TaxID=36987 RepID=A0A6L2PFP0_COPFO|nr:hypothetical protein Cfor_06087 [Coptotermes formosanus]
MTSLTQNRDSNLISEDNGIYDWREFLCGWGAAFINISITYPINKLIFRQVRNSSCHHISCVSVYLKDRFSYIIIQVLLHEVWVVRQDVVRPAPYR